MLEIVGFCALAYLAFRFLPAVIEAGFKFAVICLGLVAFMVICAVVWLQVLHIFG